MRVETLQVVEQRLRDDNIKMSVDELGEFVYLRGFSPLYDESKLRSLVNDWLDFTNKPTPLVMRLYAPLLLQPMIKKMI